MNNKMPSHCLCLIKTKDYTVPWKPKNPGIKKGGWEEEVS